MRNCLVAGLVLATTLSAATVGATGDLTIFERLHLLDSNATAERSLSTDLVRRMEQTDEQLAQGWQTVDVALRAARPIRREVTQSLSRWLSAHRAGDREAVDAPSAASDTQRLLRYASKKALSSKLRDVDVIQRADAERASFSELLSRRAHLTIELARATSGAEASVNGREAVLADARGGGAAADLDATAAEFSQTLLALAPVAPEYDFHRSKGTLARPLTQPPDHHFGARAPLVRGTGWTYRAEIGNEVHAIDAGEVVFTGAVEGWGLAVVIDHGGHYRSAYGHLSTTTMQVGDRVERADVIAAAGETGSLDGARLYFELQKRGEPIDPAPWFLRH